MKNNENMNEASKASATPAKVAKVATAKTATAKVAKVATQSATKSELMSYRGLQDALSAIKQEGQKLNAVIRNISALLDIVDADSEIRAIANYYGITPCIGGAALKEARNKVTASLYLYAESQDGAKFPARVVNIKENGVITGVEIKITSWINGMRFALNRWRKGLPQKSIKVELKAYTVNEYKDLIG